MSSEGLRYDVDEKPPHLLSAALGFQIVLLIVAGIVLIPVIVLRAAGAGADEMAWAVFATLLVSGAVTILQARPIGPVGAGYVLFMGTSGAFIAVSTTAVKNGGLPLLGTLVALSALVQFLFAMNLSRMRTVITPTVGGTVVMLIAVSVYPICFSRLTSLPPGTPAGSMIGFIPAVVTFVTVLTVSLFSRGQLRLWGPLLGVIVGCVTAAFTGLLDLSLVRDAAWFGMPSSGWPGLDVSFDSRLWSLLPAFVLVTIVGAIETYGDGVAIQRMSHRTSRPLDHRRVQGAVNADGLGNLLSGLLGTLPNTTYSTSLSVVDVTGVAARRVGFYGGGLIMVLAFLPKASGLIQSVPDAVVGAYVLVLLVLLFAHGLRLVSEGGLSYEDGFVVCMSFWIGIGFQNRLIFPDQIPESVYVLLGNGMTSGGICAVVLTGLLAARKPKGAKLRLEPRAASVTPLAEFLAERAQRAGWDAPAMARLQLAGEEALLFLIEALQRIDPQEKSPVRLSAGEADGRIVLEFLCGPGSENLRSMLDGVEHEAAPTEEDIGLRLLHSLAAEVEHEQFNEQMYLKVVIDSSPLS